MKLQADHVARAISPNAIARVAGVIYLFIIGAGLFAEALVRDRLIVPANPAATAANLLAHENLFRWGIAADLSTFVLAIALTLILYALLKAVNHHVALLMVFFNLVQDAIGGVNVLNTYEPLQILKGAGSLRAFTADQLQSMALLSLRAHAVGFAIALLFFAMSCLALAYLICKSGFLPRALGILIGIAGICYLVNTWTLILAPAVAARIFPSILMPAFVGELSLALWLTIKGVNLSKREDRADSIGTT